MAFVNLHAMPEAMAIMTIPFYLTGAAELWFAALDDIVKTSLSNVKTAFMKRFQPTSKLNMDLLHVEQREKETVEEFIHRIMCATSDRKIDTDWLIHAITTGFRPSIQETVINADPHSLEDLRDVAKRAELAESLRIKKEQNEHVNFVFKGPRKNDRPRERQGRQACSRCGRSCLSPDACIAKGENCYYCNKLNHFWHVCKFREADMKRGGSWELKFRPRRKGNVTA